ncbi:hypothetical protein LB507_004372, partial [Fusarium sp. FIESC RH6]
KSDTLLSRSELVECWRDEYDWRKFEAFLNTFNHYKTQIEVDGFESLDIHFIHQKSSREDAIPLLFLHGRPGSFLDVTRILLLLTKPAEDKQAFHVAAPSLPGYGFSQYYKKARFGPEQYAQCFVKLMKKLSYDRYICQGSTIVRYMAVSHPSAAQAIHINMSLALPPDRNKSHKNFTYEQDLENRERTNWFTNNKRSYQRIQETKPVTLCYTLNNSPTKDKLIHWAFINYHGSPSAAMQIYREAEAVLNANPDSILGRHMSQPVGGSVFPKELCISPREWTEEACSVQYWKQHEKGGHFIAWDRPEVLVEDVGEFYGKPGPVFGTKTYDNQSGG